MEEKGTFDHLVSNLQQNDKLMLLDKIKSRTVLSSEPLIDEKQRAAPERPENQYQKLSILLRIWYWLAGLFSGRSPMDVFTNSLAAAEGRAINESYPGMFDSQENMLLEKLCHEIQNLKNASRFFYTALDSSFNRDKGAFFGYLASLEMPELHEGLIDGSDPNKLAYEHPEMFDAKLRAAALEFVDSKISAIPETSRQAMYENSRMLIILKTLSSFLFDRLIMAFNQKSGDNKQACPFPVVRSQLYELANILYSLKKIPSLDLMSALFMFSMAEHQDQEDFDQDKELQKFLQKAEKSIMVIRSFNKNVPLLKIIRCASRVFNWEPAELSGGEDWLPVYKNYWLDFTNQRFSSWIKERKTAELLHSFETFFPEAALQPIENAWSAENDDGIPVDNVLALSFLLTFHKLIFMPEINVVIRPVLVDGEFYKKENRTEFLEAYNVIIKLDDVIKNFNALLAPSGEYGKVWMQIEGDMQSIAVRRRKTQALIDEINQKVTSIVSEAQASLVSMRHVLNGIMEHNENSKYDTLVNFAKIAGKGTTFTDGILKAISRIKTAVEIIADIQETTKIET